MTKYDYIECIKNDVDLLNELIKNDSQILTKKLLSYIEKNMNELKKIINDQNML